MQLEKVEEDTDSRTNAKTIPTKLLSVRHKRELGSE